MKLPRGRKRVIIFAVPTVAACVVAALAFVLWPRGGTPITSEKALEEFRSSRPGPQRSSASGEDSQDTTGQKQGAEQLGTGSEAGAATATPGSESSSTPSEVASGGAASAGPSMRVPAAGVYVYIAQGYERVSLGPADQTRQLASAVSGTVRPSGACWVFTHSLFVEHTEDTTYCLDDTGSLVVRQHTKHQKLGVVTATADMRCEPMTVVPGVNAAGASWEARCPMETHTPVFTAGSLHQGTTAVVGAEALDVGGRTVQTWHVRTRRTVSGDLSGFWHEDIWFAQVDGLPVRIVRDAELRGPATFREQSTFALRSLEPST